MLINLGSIFLIQDKTAFQEFWGPLVDSLNMCDCSGKLQEDWSVFQQQSNSSFGTDTFLFHGSRRVFRMWTHEKLVTFQKGNVSKKQQLVHINCHV